MAKSQGQIQISCQLCEIENKKIDWKCLECELLMCTNCREKIHAKVKTAGDHTVICIKDIGGNFNVSPKKLDFTNIKCPSHGNQVCCLSCNTCDTLVCGKCIAQSHNGHKLMEIQEAYDLTLAQLKESQNKAEDNISELIRREKFFDALVATQTEKHHEVNQSINNQKKYLSKKIEQFTKELIDESENELRNLNLYVQKEKASIYDMRKCLEEKLSDIERSIRSQDVVKLMYHKTKTDTLVEPLNRIQIEYSGISDFVRGEIKKENIGSFRKHEDLSAKVEMKVLKTYATGLVHIHFICTCTDGSLWLNDCKNDIIKRVQPRNNGLEVLNTFNMRVFSMVVVPGDDLLVTTGLSTIMKISSRTGKLTDSIYSVPEEIITSIHLTQKMKLLIGARTKGQRYAPSGQRKILLMDLKGEVEMIYELDKTNNPLFTYPRYIASTSNNNIGIVDWFSDSGNGQIVILGESGDLISKYKGNSPQFILGGITTTKSDNFVAVDVGNHMLHILNSHGNFQSRFDTTSIGILSPYYIAFSSTDKLYIGGLSSDKENLFDVEHADF